MNETSNAGVPISGNTSFNLVSAFTPSHMSTPSSTDRHKSRSLENRTADVSSVTNDSSTLPCESLSTATQVIPCTSSDEVTSPGQEAGATISVMSSTPSLKDSVEMIWEMSSEENTVLSPSVDILKWVEPSLPNDENVIVTQTLRFIKLNIPEYWMCVPTEDAFLVLMMCRVKESAVQRRVFVAHDGTVEISVHRQSLRQDIYEGIVNSVPTSVSFTDSTWRQFAKRVVFLVRRVNFFEICSGADNVKYKDLWKSSENGIVDNNPYGEQRYDQTCRSKSCSFLLNPKMWRCHECEKLKEAFRKKRLSHQGNHYKPNTANIHLDEEQKVAKLKRQHDEIWVKQIRIERMTKRMKEALLKDGVRVDKEISDFLMESLEAEDVVPGSLFEKFDPLRKLFLKEQIKVSNVKGPSGVTWHPAIIRFALLIRSGSKSAYNALQGTGFIKLPSDRTLYEYSHVLTAKEGCQEDKVDKIREKLKQYQSDCQSFHVLMFDEMHVSKNLVYLKSTGDLVGYANLSDVEKELHDLETFVNSDDDNISLNPPIATQMLTFMIKGVANDVEETVATYTTTKLNQYDLYSRFWDVMVKLEKRGIRIIAAVCDGCSVNRAFIKMHTPYTKLPSGIVFDTLNLCTDGRILYFLSDVPHLLKTARNCFFSSGYGPSHAWLLTLNNEHIVWETIKNMFNSERTKTWRRCRKLNDQNVNLNRYSRMKVSYAAEVLSNTVATDLESMGWDSTKETVIFIRWFNDFFDMLNGAYSYHDVRTKNQNLAPYCSIHDDRFVKLMEFLEYLHNWKQQVDSLEGHTQAQKNKMLLNRGTLEGIEMSIRGFIGATKFLLSAGTKFVNARIFSKIHLSNT